MSGSTKGKRPLYSSSNPASKVPKCLGDEGKVCLCLTQFIAIILKEIIAVIDATFPVSKRKPEKKIRLVRDSKMDLYDTGAALNQMSAAPASQRSRVRIPH